MSVVIPLGDLLVRLTGDATQFEKMIFSAEKQITSAADRLTRFGAGLTVGLTAPIMGFAGLSVKAFATFEDSMIKGASLMSGVTEKVRKEMDNAALRTDAPLKAAESFETMARAGYNAQQSIKLLGVAEQFAKANSIDYKQAVETLANAQRTLGMKSKDTEQNTKNAARISDVLTAASLRSGSSVEQLSDALEHRGAAALRRHNISLEQGVAILSTFSQMGIKGARAGRELEAVLDGKGNPKLVQALQASREETSKFADALSNSGGTAMRIMEEREKSLSQQFERLKGSMEAISIEIGSKLAPLVKKINDYIKVGLNWWQSQNDQFKDTAIKIALVAASIGPLYVGLGLVVKVMMGLVALVSWSSLAFIGWTAAAVILVGALALVTDAILQMTGKGNLGLIDMVNNFRVSGVKISTWMTTAWLLIFDAWEWVSARVVAGVMTLELTFMELGSSIHRSMTKVWQKIVEGYYEMQRILHIITEDEFVAKMLDSQKAFNESVDASLNESKKRYETYYNDLNRMHQESEDKRAAYQKTIDDLFADDEASRLQEEEKARVGASTKSGEMKVPGVDLPDFEAPDLSGIGKGLGSGSQAKDQSFMVTNLNRFNLEGPGGLARPIQKQEVSAKGVEARLDTLIDVTRGKPPVAVLGD